MEIGVAAGFDGDGHPSSGPGEMAARIGRFDWSTTPLGPTGSWPQSLRTALEIVLSSRYPMFVWWGKELVNLYNDAYRPFLGKKHPQALGQSAREVWAEIWRLIGPRTEAVLARAESTFDEALMLIMDRFGYPEETYFTFSYSPVRNDEGEIGGLFCAVTDETPRIIGERRLRLLREVAASFSTADTPEHVCAVAAECIARNPRDLPFALLYLMERDGRAARLVAQAGIEPGAAGAEPLVEMTTRAPWPFADVAHRNELVVVEDPAAHLGRLPTGAWDRGPERAVVVPLGEQGQTGIAGFLVAGLNPYLLFDEEYRGFIALLAGQISSGMANARAYQEERRRAESLAELDRAKTAFFSNISHELRTPLTLMLGPLEEALASPDGAAAGGRENLALAHRNGLRLLRLINALLDFSRVEAGRIQAMYQPTDLAAFTSELASNFRSACEKAGLSLNITAERLPRPVFVDREMWEKIVLNLVSNAFKFTFEGRIDVTLRAEDDHVVLRVADTGTGIPESELPFIFERFHRVEGARGRTHEGTGIGLALVQELVRLHNGGVAVESTLGRGTTFTVRIPFGAAHLPPERLEDAGRHVSTATRAEAFVSEALRSLPDGVDAEPKERTVPAPLPAAQSRPRILLADDNADMRDYLLRILRTQYEATAVANGEEALAAARGARPDLILTDVMMPRLDGVGLLQRLRADPALRDVPVVILSARAGEEATAEAMMTGADDYLVKPFSARELLARVGAHIKMARTRREIAEALRHRTAQFETLLGRAPIGVFLVDTDFRMLEINPVALPEFGAISGSVLGRDVRELLPVIWERKYADEIIQIFQRTLETGEAFVTSEWCGVRADRGTTEHYEWNVDRIALPDGRHGLVCYFRDISERVSAESTRQLLLRELSHRVKNTLATVQAIAQQTLRQTNEPRDFAARFSGRLQSLARVHSLLTDSSWEGADLRQLISGQLLEGAVDESRLTASGPAIRLAPQMSVHLALTLHELGTNSAKYGALSTADGRVTVDWTLKDEQLHLRWIERGGPAVRTPFSRGFGTKLIEQSAKSLGGSAQLSCEAGGVRWDIVLPLPHVATLEAFAGRDAAPARAAREEAGARSASALAGCRLLVIEDEPVIALDFADALQGAGAYVLGPVGTEAEALQMIETCKFDCALLDANLHGRSIDAVAAALTRRNIPFVFVTGYGGCDLQTSFRHAPVLAKPVGERQLIDALLAVRQRDGVLTLRSS